MNRATISDGCGCFPTGHHYAGIAHLLRTAVRGLVAGILGDSAWRGLKIALIDVETTGRDPSLDRVIELGIAIGQDGEIIARHNWLINPGRTIPAEAQAVHGISDAHVADAPRFEVVAAEICAAIEGCVPGAYNAPFDRAFVTNEIARAGASGVSVSSTSLARDVEWFDPLVWAREIQREEKSKALGETAARLGIQNETAHRASSDAETALRVLYAFSSDGRMPQTYATMVQEQRRLAQAQADARRRWRS